MVARALLPALILALLLGAGAAAPARAQGPGPPILPGTRPPGQPERLPEALPPVVYPFPSLQLLIGSDFLNVTSDDPQISLDPGSPFSTGALLGLDWVGEHWRLGYLRRIYRHALPEGAVFRGQEVDFLGIEVDALWVHGGFRPARFLYLGLGLSAQHRRLSFTPKDPGQSEALERLETAASADVLLEYAFQLPFAVQARYARDFPGPRVELNGWSVLIAYTVPL